MHLAAIKRWRVPGNDESRLKIFGYRDHKERRIIGECFSVFPANSVATSFLHESKTTLKKYIWDYAFLLTLGGLIIALDQWTKELVRDNLALYEIWNPFGDWLEPYARIIHSNNTGMAFGQLPEFSIVFTTFSIVAVIAVLNFFPVVPWKDWLPRLALTLVFGGAGGNLVDRLFHGGGVTDFISVGNFAIFNVADSSISVAAVLIILPSLPHLWQEYKHSRKDKIKQIRKRYAVKNPHGEKQAQTAKSNAELASLSFGIVEIILNSIVPPPRFVLGLRAWRIHHKKSHRLGFWEAVTGRDHKTEQNRG